MFRAVRNYIDFGAHTSRVVSLFPQEHACGNPVETVTRLHDSASGYVSFLQQFNAIGRVKEAAFADIQNSRPALLLLRNP
jgi:hypothetical protein